MEEEVLEVVEWVVVELEEEVLEVVEKAMGDQVEVMTAVEVMDLAGSVVVA